MKAVLSLALVLGVACGVHPVAAQKSPGNSAVSYPFWSRKGAPARAFVPGLNAALLLTPEQSRRIQEAQDAAQQDAELQKAREVAKQDPNATEGQKEAAREKLTTAAARLRRQVDALLTPEQRELIERVNTAAAEASARANDELQVDFASAKGNDTETRRLRDEAQTRATVELSHRLEMILTPAQREAVAQAATEERRRAAESPKGKQPK